MKHDDGDRVYWSHVRALEEPVSLAAFKAELAWTRDPNARQGLLRALGDGGAIGPLLLHVAERLRSGRDLGSVGDLRRRTLPLGAIVRATVPPWGVVHVAKVDTARYMPGQEVFRAVGLWPGMTPADESRYLRDPRNFRYTWAAGGDACLLLRIEGIGWHAAPTLYVSFPVTDAIIRAALDDVLTLVRSDARPSVLLLHDATTKRMLFVSVEDARGPYLAANAQAFLTDAEAAFLRRALAAAQETR